MMTRADIETLYPLSPLQQGLLAHALQAPDSQAYFGQQIYRLEGPLETANLQHAWQRAIDRHAALRTAFVWEGVDRMTQVVLRRVDAPWVYLDWSDAPAAENRARLDHLLVEDRRYGIDVSQAPLLRLHLIRFAPDIHYLVVSQHHLVLDGWSYGLVLKEVMAHYQALQAGTVLNLPAPPPYQAFIDWLARQELWRAEEFWRRQLRGFDTRTPILFMRPGALRRDYSELHWDLPENETARLGAFARRLHVTLSAVIQCAWALLVDAADENDVLFGVATSIRPPSLPGSEMIVGPMLNTIPMRVQFTKDMRIQELLKRLLADQIDAQGNSFPSLVQIHGWSGVSPGEPLFDSVVVVENYPTDVFEHTYGADWLGDGSLRIFPLEGFARTHYPLTVHVLGTSKLRFEFVYDTGGFSVEAIRLLMKRFQLVIDGMIRDADLRVCELPLVSTEDRARLLVWSTGRPREYSGVYNLNDMIAAHALRTPHNIAVESASRTLTYGELEKDVNQMAGYLREIGVGREVRVAIHLERDWQAAITILAVMKAGGVFVPIDAAAPTKRVGSILDDSNAAVIITTSQLADRLPGGAHPIICFDQQWDEIQQRSDGPVLGAPLDRDSLVYILFTSGSTGRPKGVGVTHGGLANYFEWAVETYDVSSGTGALVHSPLSFDLTLTSFFAPLATGGRVVMAPTDGDLAALSNIVGSAQDHSLVKLTPSHLRALNELKVDGNMSFTDARVLVVGGEQLLFEDLRRCAGPKRPRIFNEYGPTETVIGCVAYEIAPGSFDFGTVPIGRPIANTQALALTSDGELAPVGVAGELYIGGAGLARGYVNDTAVTAEKFIPNPFCDKPGMRLYRTGDQVRWLPNGQLEYVGRLDEQVKVRGYRVELGEIEAVLSRHPNVRCCVAVARAGDTVSDVRLVCYVVARSPELPVAQMREWCQAQLPSYMIPAAFVLIDELPLTANGKIDRRALPEPDWTGSAPDVECDPPQTETEKQLAAIWQDVLNRENIGRNENFFRIGGHSLLATQVVSRTQILFQLPIPFRIAFDAPTISEFAKRIEALQACARDGSGLDPGPMTQTIPSIVNLDNLSEEELDEYLASLEELPS